MDMYNLIGYSAYISMFDKQQRQLSSLYREGSTVFTSFHLSEELDDNYIDNAVNMCKTLNSIGYKIIGDVSPKTLNMFNIDSLKDFSKMMNIDILRLDYGYNENEIIDIAQQIPVCLNATTMTDEFIIRLGEGLDSSYSNGAKDNISIYAMHNFYPRPETGLDENIFRKRNQLLKQAGMQVIAFVPGDMEKRGPIYDGLTTLEEHRYVAPYAAYIDLIKNYNIDQVFIGDGTITTKQAEWIDRYNKEKIINLPVVFEKGNEHLYNQIFTIRNDSPLWLMRLKESREYACFGHEITPNNCITRPPGSITVDNIKYARYSGEIQIIKEELATDERVNVIGKVPDEYHILLRNIYNGEKIRFVKCI